MDKVKGGEGTWKNLSPQPTTRALRLTLENTSPQEGASSSVGHREIGLAG